MEIPSNPNPNPNTQHTHLMLIVLLMWNWNIFILFYFTDLANFVYAGVIYGVYGWRRKVRCAISFDVRCLVRVRLLIWKTGHVHTHLYIELKLLNVLVYFDLRAYYYWIRMLMELCYVVFADF